jgi:cyanophycinase
VFPTASDEPVAEGTRIVEAIKKMGADAFLVPVAVDNIEEDYHEAVADPELIEQVKNAGGVYFIGGDQGLITQALYDDDGNNTPLLDAIWEMYHNGGVIGGSSAGAAVMSAIMYRNPNTVLRTLQTGVTMGREIDRGLGFMDPDWFVEQHCLTRGRFARALVAMHSQGIKYGIGVDDNTALVVRGRQLTVIGHKGAVLLDLSQATSDPEVKGFNLKNVRLSYLDRGDSLDLDTVELTPSEEKLSERKIDPNDADFAPAYHDPLFINDILGNSAMCDLLRKLVDCKASEAIGLAYNGAVARKKPAFGFEFRFYREGDTLGWYTEAHGSEDYTVSNIHLDIRPVKVTGPLYQ